MAEFFSLQTTLQYFLRFLLRVSWCGEYFSGVNWKALVLKEGCLKSPTGLIKQLSKSYIHYLYKVQKDEYVMIKSCLFIHIQYIYFTYKIGSSNFGNQKFHTDNCWVISILGCIDTIHVNLKLNSPSFNVACSHGKLCYFNNRHFTFL